MPTVRTQSPSAAFVGGCWKVCFLASRRSTQEPLGQAAGRHRPGARLVNEGEAEPGSSPKKAANG